jgi:hypothetical protein
MPIGHHDIYTLGTERRLNRFPQVLTTQVLTN